MKKISMTTILIAGMSTLSQAAITASYGVTTNSPSVDGWAGANVGSWVAGGYSGTRYLRNESGGTDHISKALETGILATDTNVKLTITARSTDNFYQFGLTQSATANEGFFGMGADFGNSNQYFIIMNGVRTNVGAMNTTDALRTFELNYDMITGVASLTVDGTLQTTTVTRTATAAALPGTDFLFMRASNQFSGAETFSIDTTNAVPEPTSTALLGLGGFALLLRRKK